MRLLSCLFLLFFVASCTQAPQPFRHSRTGVDTSGLRLRDAGIVKILPMEGTSIPMGKILASSLADSLGARNIPATSNPLKNPSYHVRGQVLLDFNSGRKNHMGSIYWTFMDRSKKVIHESSQEIRGDVYQWEYGDQKLIDDLVENAADQFAGYLQDENEKKAVELDPKDRPVTFTITQIEGALGSGEAELRKAMGLTLRQFGASVRRQPNEHTYRLSADIDILDPFEGKQRIIIAWIVKDAEGKELGRARQNNQLDAGAFEGRWGRLAYDISRAAMPGIGQVVERHRSEQAFEASRGQRGTSAAPGHRKRLTLPPF
ncbi:hypothetical protein RYZ26_00505 [Terasakiella sp. A23]|uniref:hypothetical protein n=1 Tax=Terasakiella sp. FCG-A23 TaxID=3080561 RepID=UPI002954DFCC|nr:hypothetical protein [Terasakiella sp. A23]MDV7338054.1 hypothetical protein [Terasakiella sp. A23]